MGERGNGTQPSETATTTGTTTVAQPKTLRLTGQVFYWEGPPPVWTPGGLPVIPLPGGGYIEFLVREPESPTTSTDDHHPPHE